MLDARTVEACRRYDDVIVPAFADPFIDHLTAPLDGPPPSVVVDLACGSGATARAVHRCHPSAVTVGVDASTEALAVAAERSPPELSWVAASAARLPSADASVDAVVCQQGVQFFRSYPVVLREVARVLVPGGRAVVLSWAAGGNPILATADRALAETEPFRQARSFDAAACREAADANGLDVDDHETVAGVIGADLDAVVDHLVGGDPAARRAVLVALAGQDLRLRADRLVLRRRAGHGGERSSS